MIIMSKEKQKHKSIEKRTDITNCNLCGLCSLNCPIYKVLLKETASPRFKLFLLKKEQVDKIFYLCTGCNACLQDCPANINIDFLDMRKKLADKGEEPKSNKLMKENIKAYGNPFGKISKNMKIEQYYT